MKRGWIVAALLSLAIPAMAQTGATALVQARAAGTVGERYDGYLGYAVQPSSGMVRSQTEAVNIRSHVLREFERASADPSLLEQGALNVVIVGGGPTGVEMAGALSELFSRVLPKDYPHLDMAKARIILVEALSFGSHRLERRWKVAR